VHGAVCSCIYDVCLEFDKQGASFHCKAGPAALDVIAVFINCPKEWQPFIDLRVLDFLYSKGVFDINGIAMAGKLVRFLWTLSKIPMRFRANPAIRVPATLYGGTYLHSAIFFDKPSVARWFLENGADVDRRTRNGATALDLAIRMGHTRCEQILRQHSAAYE